MGTSKEVTPTAEEKEEPKEAPKKKKVKRRKPAQKRPLSRFEKISLFGFFLVSLIFIVLYILPAHAGSSLVYYSIRWVQEHTYYILLVIVGWICAILGDFCLPLVKYKNKNGRTEVRLRKPGKFEWDDYDIWIEMTNGHTVRATIDEVDKRGLTFYIWNNGMGSYINEKTDELVVQSGQCEHDAYLHLKNRIEILQEDLAEERQKNLTREMNERMEKMLAMREGSSASN